MRCRHDYAAIRLKYRRRLLTPPLHRHISRQPAAKMMPRHCRQPPRRRASTFAIDTRATIAEATIDMPARAPPERYVEARGSAYAYGAHSAR